MSRIEVNMTYEPFSKEPEYIRANQEFIRSVDLSSCKKILDLACGTGTMTDLLMEQYPGIELVVGLDISRESLILAQTHFKEAGLLNGQKGSKIFLFQGTADILALHNLSVDAVIMGNSIHLLKDEEILLAEVQRVLRPGCLFIFNSSFYAGTMPKGTEKFHHEWVKQALSYILQKDEELKKQGLRGIPRKRGTARRAFSKPWPSVDDWGDMLNRQGFEVKQVNERTVLMNQRCFETIGAYAGLASVLFSGYPVEIASEALQETAITSLAAVEMDVVPRLWLEITAIKN